MKTNIQNQNTETPELMNRIAQQGKAVAKAIFFHGPEPARNKDGDEIPSWCVYAGDDDGEPVRTVYHVHSFKRAQSLARIMSAERKLELICEAQPA